MTTATSNLESSNLNTKIAGEAMEANRLVKGGTVEGEVLLATAITDIAIGVTRHKAAIGESVEIQTGGEAKIYTTAVALALNAQVMPGPGGAVLLAAGATARSVGIVMTATGGTLGELATVRLNVPNISGPANA